MGWLLRQEDLSFKYLMRSSTKSWSGRSREEGVAGRVYKEITQLVKQAERRRFARQGLRKGEALLRNLPEDAATEDHL
jgi:hypothetical protein